MSGYIITFIILMAIAFIAAKLYADDDVDGWVLPVLSAVCFVASLIVLFVGLDKDDKHFRRSYPASEYNLDIKVISHTLSEELDTVYVITAKEK